MSQTPPHQTDYDLRSHPITSLAITAHHIRSQRLPHIARLLISCGIRKWRIGSRQEKLRKLQEYAILDPTTSTRPSHCRNSCKEKKQTDSVRWFAPDPPPEMKEQTPANTPTCSAICQRTDFHGRCGHPFPANPCCC